MSTFITLSPASCSIHAHKRPVSFKFPRVPIHVYNIFLSLAYLLRSSALWQPYRVEKEKLRAVNKKLKKYALWSEKRQGNVAGDAERRRAKKIKREA